MQCSSMYFDDNVRAFSWYTLDPLLTGHHKSNPTSLSIVAALTRYQSNRNPLRNGGIGDHGCADTKSAATV